MSKDFAYCKICRRNHDQGKGHKYSAKHKDSLSKFLAKALKKIKDVTFFLENVQCLRDEDRHRNQFWCYFCEEEVKELESIFICSNAIKHLSSSKHADSVLRFCCEHGVNLQKQQLYIISEQNFTKWEESCKLSTSSRAFCEGVLQLQNSNRTGYCRRSPLHLSQNLMRLQLLAILVKLHSQTHVMLKRHIHLTREKTMENMKLLEPICKWLYEGKQSVWNSFSQTSLYHSEASFSIPSDGYNHLMTKQYVSARSSVKVQGRFAGQTASLYHTFRTSDEAEENSLVSCSPLVPFEGNVHSGAPPPWVISDETKTEVQSIDRNSKGSSSLTLSRTQQRKLAKLRNPKRVGAAWAEQRRAELERQQEGQSQQVADDGKIWLPSFGRVWQSGSRKESRKEFEEEKRQDERKFKVMSAETPHLQPYISKRLRTDPNS